MGELEESVDVVDETIKDVHVTMSYETAKKARTVISAVCQLGIRRHAMTSDPVRSIEALTRGHGTADDGDKTTAEDAVPAMTEAQIQDMFRGLEAFCRTKVEETDRVGRRLGKRGAVWSDLPDLAEASLSTGTRFGEALALTGDDVQPYQDKATGQRRVRININAHLIYDEGKGIRRVPGRKGGRPGILVRVPDWSEGMWLRRKDQAGNRPLFPAVGGGWLDQANCNKRLRAALDGAGFTWVTARVWRKTLGTLMRRAGRSSEDIAEQLGNTRAVAEKHYIAPPTMTEVGAEVLEMINPPRSAE